MNVKIVKLINEIRVQNGQYERKWSLIESLDLLIYKSFSFTFALKKQSEPSSREQTRPYQLPSQWYGILIVPYRYTVVPKKPKWRIFSDENKNEENASQESCKINEIVNISNTKREEFGGRKHAHSYNFINKWDMFGKINARNGTWIISWTRKQLIGSSPTAFKINFTSRIN